MRTLVDLLRVLSKFRRKFRRCLFTSFIKREITNYVVVQWRPRNEPNSALCVQRCVLIALRFCCRRLSQILRFLIIRAETILGDSGADSGGEGKAKRAEKHGTKKSKERREEPYFTFLRAIFFRPFRLSLAPTICPWVSEDEPRRDC